MEPLEAIPPAVWRSVVGVATDLDDTLTAHGRLTAASLIALDTLSAMNLPCVIATGRPVGWAEVLAGLLPVRAVVAENGGAWAAREGTAARVAFIEDEATRTHGMQQSRAMARRVTERFPTLQPVVEHVLRATDVTLDVGERVTVPRALVDEALAMVRDGGLHGVASTVHLHISHRAPDKTAGLRAALADVGLAPAALDAAWLYLGDSPNDAGPFAAMALSVGVRGVDRLAMPALPRYVCRAGAGEALTELVDALRRHREAA
jgi:HAD superfamily hydrolase (TIGR01484 family)